MAESEARSASYWWWLEHKFFLLLATALLTVLVGPWLSERIGRSHALQQRRIDAALEISRQGIEVERRLARVHVRLSNFHKDVWRARLSSDDFAAAQKELRTALSEDYLEFHRVGWAWIHEVSVRLKVLGLAEDGEIALLNALGQAYSKCLGLSTTALDRLWGPFTTDKPNEHWDPALAATVEGRFDSYSVTLRTLVEQMAELFAHHRRPVSIVECSE